MAIIDYIIPFLIWLTPENLTMIRDINIYFHYKKGNKR